METNCIIEPIKGHKTISFILLLFEISMEIPVVVCSNVAMKIKLLSKTKMKNLQKQNMYTNFLSKGNRRKTKMTLIISQKIFKEQRSS